MFVRHKRSLPWEAEKRIKKQRASAIAAVLMERNRGVRISEESSGSPSNQQSNTEEVNETNQVKKKKTRGPSKLKLAEKGKKPIQLEYNERSQPIGSESVQLSTFLGRLARELVPLGLKEWLKLPKELENRLWTCVKQKFDKGESERQDVIQRIGVLFANYKSELSGGIRRAATSHNDMAHQLALLKPYYVSSTEWEAFVKHRLSPEFIEKSKKFQEIRALQTLPHTMSRMGYARLEDNMRKESPTPVAIKRPDVWVSGHTKKNGEPINEKVAETMRKIHEYPQPLTTEDLSSIREDAVSHVFGPERRGRVRGLGFGVTPSRLNAQIQQGGKTKKLQNKVDTLEHRLTELQSIILAMRQDEGQSKGVEDVMHTPQSDHGSVGIQGNSGNLVNAKCKLLHWAGTGVLVAHGQIASTDPHSLVHHVILGTGSWKVWVNEVVEDVPLFRPTRELFTIGDAKGTTVAWPNQYINLDD